MRNQKIMLGLSCMYKLSQNLLPRLLFKSQKVVTFFLTKMGENQVNN